MEKEKTIFDYLGQVLIVFGVTTLILNVFCIVFGESAKEMSTMFALGRQGISVSTSLEFFMMSVVVITFRFLFFTDKIIKNMSLTARTGMMYIAVVLIILIMNWIFGWFPVDVWEAWVGFILSFGASIIISTVTVFVKDRVENKKMQDALDKMKQNK